MVDLGGLLNELEQGQRENDWSSSREIKSIRYAHLKVSSLLVTHHWYWNPQEESIDYVD